MLPAPKHSSLDADNSISDKGASSSSCAIPTSFRIITPVVLLILCLLTLTQFALIPFIRSLQTIPTSDISSKHSPSSPFNLSAQAVAQSDSAKQSHPKHTSKLPNRRTTPSEHAPPQDDYPYSEKVEPAKEDWQKPRPLHTIFSMTRQRPDADFHANHDWSQPMVIMTYARPLAGSPNITELFMYTTGVSMGSFERNFSVHGCMVGKDIYPMVRFQWDLMRCEVTRTIQQGEPLTAILYRDDTFEKAVRGPVIIGREFEAELSEGDIIDLDDDVVFHSSPYLSKNDFAAIRSFETWGKQMDPFEVTHMPSLPRYELCAMTLMKPYPYLLPDWIDYHRRIGIDMIFLFDNHADDDLSKVYADRSDIEVVYWPWERAQMQANTFFLTAARARCEWVLFSDSDEYIMVGVGEGNQLIDRRPLKEFVAKRRRYNFKQIMFYYLLFGSSGHVRLPKGPIPEEYIHLHEDQNRMNGKVICQTDLDWIKLSIHWGQATELFLTYGDDRNMTYPVGNDDTPSLVHYQFRSWEDLIIKRQFGSPSTVDALPMGKGDLSVDNPPKVYTSYVGHEEFTYFRDIWRRVTQRVPLDMQAIVQRKGKKRCLVRYRVASEPALFYNEKCSVK